MCRTVNIYAAFQQILRFVQHNRELAKREMGKGVSGKGKRVMGNGKRSSLAFRPFAASVCHAKIIKCLQFVRVDVVCN